MCRLGSDSENSDGRSYVVTGSGSGFQVTEENTTPQSSPNPRAASKYSNGNINRWTDVTTGGQTSQCLYFSVTMNSSRDRTAEFRTTVQSLRGRQINGAVRNTKSVRQNSDFINIAKSISQDITNTYTKLEKLTLLCKRKTIFDDKPVEIQELTYIIKHDIAELNKQISQLQNIAK